MKASVARIAIDGSTAENRVMSFAPIQEEVDRYISQFKEGYFPPLSMLARLTEELGELARALSHREGFKKPKAGEDEGDVEDELCDLIFVAVCLANSLDIDLDQAFARTMQKYYVRDKDRWTRKE
jgi:NTP pyrophosphatase (non-canonical NTP hydrolase)